jgi:hypothetical protein
MSERGVFAVDRGIWDHDVLVDDQPFSRREAWLWLLSEAAWKPHRRRLAGRSVELDRGQCAASLRFLAGKWRWTESRVRRFLDLLKSEGMIDAATDAGITVITISKYDRYQRVSLPNDATIASLPDAAPTQERHKVEGTEHKEDFKAAARGNAAANARTVIGLNITNAPTPSARSSISDEAFDLARQVVDAIGSGAVDHPIEVGAPAHCQKWINEGWKPQFCLIVVRQVMNRRGHDNPPNTLKFFDKAISQYLDDALDDVPAWAVENAVRRWHRSECGGQHNYAFAPAPGVLRGIALQELEPAKLVLRRLKLVLSAAPSLAEAEKIASASARSLIARPTGG